MYLSALLENPQGLSYTLAATVDPDPTGCSRREELETRGVPHYLSLDDCYRNHAADLVILATPIHRHADQTILALEHGSHVLCEKPAAATAWDVDRMIEAEAQSGRRVAVGFQWSFTSSIRRLKQDIRDGVFGKPVRLRSLCLWPRDESYYNRNDWAGRLRDKAGHLVLDSPVNNAMAHDLHNLLYLIGADAASSAEPVELVAEAYRANEIDSFDTAAVRVHTESGVEVLFLGSHAVSEESDPAFTLEFTSGVVRYDGGYAPIAARFGEGLTKEYPSPQQEPHAAKLWAFLEAITQRGPVACGLEAARAHTVCVGGVHASVPTAAVFPAEIIKRSGSPGRKLTYAQGLAETLRECYTQAALPGELGVPWACAGRRVRLAAR